MGIGKWHGWLLPCPLSPMLGHRTGNSPFIRLLLSYCLYSLSPLFRRVATGSLAGWVSPDVCPYPCKSGDEWHGTALTDYIATLISTNVLVSQMSYSYPTRAISCPRHLVDASCPYLPIWILLCLDGLLVLLSKEVLEGWDCPGGKWQLVPQKDLYPLSILTVHVESYHMRHGWFRFE
jgi:hypothetical protein